MNTDKKIAAAIALVLFVYLLLRSIYTPIVHDEAATFFHYIHSGNYWPYQAHWDANNHIVNSLLANLFYGLLGKSTFAIRLPNLLAFLPFAYFAWQLCKTLSTRTLRLLGYLALISAQLVFEFFALARGYGLSMAFLLGMLYYLKLYLADGKLKQLVYLLVFMNLAIWSNLSLNNTYLILLGLLSIFIIVKATRQKDKQLGAQALVLFCLGYLMFLLAVLYAFDLKERGALYYGALDGIIPVTFETLMLCTFGNLAIWKNVIITACLLVFTLVALRQYVKSHYSLKLPVLTLCLLFFVGNIIGAILLAQLFKVNYPEDRAGLYFLPFGILGFVWAINELYLRYNWTKHLAWILLVFPLQTLLNANITHSRLWKGQTVSNEFYNYLQKEAQKEGKHISVGSYHLQELSWAFLNLDHPTQLSPTQRIEYPDYSCDYQIVSDSLWYELAPTHIKLLEDKANAQLLLKRKKSDNYRVLFTQTKESSAKDIQDEYFGFFERIGADSLPKGPFQIDLKCKISAAQKPYKSHIVVSAQDSLGKQLIYDFIPIDWLSSECNNRFLNLSRRYSALPANAHRLVVYLWNIEKTKFEINEPKATLSELRDNDNK